jgi:hypothetical protein
MCVKRSKVLLVAAAGAYLLGGATSALAINDHLKCYKAKESSGPGKIQVTASLVSGTVPPLAAESGCVLKGPPKLVCAPVTKVGATPTPPGGGPTGATTKFLCYKVKCPKAADQTITGKDQFGTHTFTIKGPKVVCAPASPSGAFLDDSAVF